MRIGVIGAGGVGGYYGALLSVAGNEVHLLARGQHLQAIREHGLKVRSVLGDFEVKPVSASDQPVEIGPVDLILFCTKTLSTEQTARSVRPMVSGSTVVVSLQNGVEAADQVGEILGKERVVGAATWISAVLTEPGVIGHLSESRRIVLGERDGRETDRVRDIHRVFTAAGITCEISMDISAVLWSKLVFVSAIAAVGSLTRLPISGYRHVPQTRALLAALMRETSAVAAGLGVNLDPNIVDDTLKYIDSSRPGIKASMQVDVEADRPSELEALIGVIIRRGAEIGVPTPVTSAVYALLLPREWDSARRRPQPIVRRQTRVR